MWGLGVTVQGLGFMLWEFRVSGIRESRVPARQYPTSTDLAPIKGRAECAVDASSYNLCQKYLYTG